MTQFALIYMFPKPGQAGFVPGLLSWDVLYDMIEWKFTIKGSHQVAKNKGLISLCEVEYTCSSVQVKALAGECTIGRWGARLTQAKCSPGFLLLCLLTSIPRKSSGSFPPQSRNSYNCPSIVCPSKDLFFFFKGVVFWPLKNRTGRQVFTEPQSTEWRDSWQSEMSALLAVLLGDFSYGFNNKIRNRTGLPWAGVRGAGEWAELMQGRREGLLCRVSGLLTLRGQWRLQDVETVNTGQPQDWPPRMKESAASAFAYPWRWGH